MAKLLKSCKDEEKHQVCTNQIAEFNFRTYSDLYLNIINPCNDM